MRTLLVIFFISTCSSLWAQTNEQKGVKALEDTVQLREVVVKATKSITRISGDGFQTDISGTVLQQLGSAVDVLGLMPGCMNNNGVIEVIGKGTPVVYVNGRRVRNANELEYLKSDRIKTIKVITTPGSRYDATTKAVIRITTEKEAGEGFAVDTKATLGYLDYLNGKGEANVNYRAGGLNVFGLLGYSKTKTKGNSENVQNVWSGSHFMQTISQLSKGWSEFYDGQLGFDYTLKNGNSFGVFYKMNHSPSFKSAFLNTSSYVDDLQEERSDIEKRTNTVTTEHLVDGYFTGKWKQWTIEATADVFWKNSGNSQVAQEQLTDRMQRNISTKDNNDAWMAAGELHLSRRLWKGIVNIGAEYSYSRRDDLFNNEEEILSDADNTIKESNAAVYLETSQRLGKVALQLGLRYEHVNSDYFETGQKIQEQSRTYNKLFPTARLSASLGRSAFQFSYTKHYNRPLYSQLSSTTVYVNRYLYESGNPLLQNSYCDELSLDWSYRWITLMASFQHTEGQIVEACSYYNNNETITLLRKENSPHDANNLQVMASVMPGFIGKYYYPVFACGLTAQFYKIDYIGQTKSMNNLAGLVRFSNIFRLPHNYTLRADLNWRSKLKSDNVEIGQVWRLNVSAARHFGKHWEVKLSLSDFFNAAHKSNYTVYSGIQDFSLEKDINTRNIECSVRYKINVTKSQYKGKGAGKKEKARL